MLQMCNKKLVACMVVDRAKGHVKGSFKNLSSQHI